MKEDERTVSTMNSFADDASINRRIQERLGHLGADETPTELSERVDQNSLWSGCTGCTGDDTLSLTHMYRAVVEEIECMYAGRRGKSVIGTHNALPYVCWPNDDASDFSSIEKDDSSKTSDISASVTGDITKESSGIKEDPTEVSSRAKEDSSEKDDSTKDPSEKVSSKVKGEETQESSDKLSRSIFFWRASSKDKITTRSMVKSPEPILPQTDPQSLEDPELEQLVKDIINPPALEKQDSIPETVNTSLGPSEHQGIETEDLSDDDSHHGNDNKSDDESNGDPIEETTMEASLPKDCDSTPSKKSKRSSRAILGKMKRAFSKNSISRHSVSSKSSKAKTEKKEAKEFIESSVPAAKPEMQDTTVAKEELASSSDEENLSLASDSKEPDSAEDAKMKAQESSEDGDDKSSSTNDSAVSVAKDLDMAPTPSSSEGAAVAITDLAQDTPKESSAEHEDTPSKPSIFARVKRSMGINEGAIEIEPYKPESESKEASVDESKSPEPSSPDESKANPSVEQKKDLPGCATYLQSNDSPIDIEREKSGNDDASEEPAGETTASREETNSVSTKNDGSVHSSPGVTPSPSEDDNLLNPIILDRVRRSFANAGILQTKDESSEESAEVKEPEKSEVAQEDVTMSDAVVSKDQEESKEEMTTVAGDDADSKPASWGSNTSREDVTVNEPDANEPTPESSNGDGLAIDTENDAPDEKEILQVAATRSQNWYDNSGFLLCQCASRNNEHLLRSLPETSEIQDGNLSSRDLGISTSEVQTKRGTISHTVSEDSIAEQNILVKIRSSVQGGLLLKLFIDVERDESKEEKKDDDIDATEAIEIQEHSDSHCDAVSVSGVSISEATVVTNNTRAVSVLEELKRDDTHVVKDATKEAESTNSTVQEENATGEGHDDSTEPAIEAFEPVPKDSLPVPKSSVLGRVKRSFAKSSKKSNADDKAMESNLEKSDGIEEMEAAEDTEAAEKELEDIINQDSSCEQDEAKEAPETVSKDPTTTPKASVLERVKRSFAKKSDCSVSSKDASSDNEVEQECSKEVIDVTNGEPIVVEDASDDEGEEVSISKVIPVDDNIDAAAEQPVKETEEPSKEEPKEQPSNTPESSTTFVKVDHASASDAKDTASVASSTAKGSNSSATSVRTVDSKKQERIAKIKEMIENAPEGEDSDDEIVLAASTDAASVGARSVASSSKALSKSLPSTVPARNKSMLPDGLPPSGRKATSSTKKRGRLSKLKRSIKKLGKPKTGE